MREDGTWSPLKLEQDKRDNFIGLAATVRDGVAAVSRELVEKAGLLMARVEPVAQVPPEARWRADDPRRARGQSDTGIPGLLPRASAFAH